MDQTHTELQILGIFLETGASVWARTNEQCSWGVVDVYIQLAIENIVNTHEVWFTVLPSIKDEYSKDSGFHYPYSGRRHFIPPAGTRLVFTNDNDENDFRCDYMYQVLAQPWGTAGMYKKQRLYDHHTHFTLDLTCFDTQVVCLLHQFFAELYQHQTEVKIINIIAMYSFGYYGVPGGGIPESGSEKCPSCNHNQRLGSVAKLLLAIKEGRFVVAPSEQKLEADFDNFMKNCHEEYPGRCCCYEDWGEKKPLHPNSRPGNSVIRNTIHALPSTQLKGLIESFVWH
jgi:hypothetical protein